MVRVDYRSLTSIPSAIIGVVIRIALSIVSPEKERKHCAKKMCIALVVTTRHYKSFTDEPTRPAMTRRSPFRKATRTLLPNLLRSEAGITQHWALLTAGDGGTTPSIRVTLPTQSPPGVVRWTPCCSRRDPQHSPEASITDFVVIG